MGLVNPQDDLALTRQPEAHQIPDISGRRLIPHIAQSKLCQNGSTNAFETGRAWNFDLQVSRPLGFRVEPQNRCFLEDVPDGSRLSTARSLNQSDPLGLLSVPVANGHWKLISIVIDSEKTIELTAEFYVALRLDVQGP